MKLFQKWRRGEGRKQLLLPSLFFLALTFLLFSTVLPLFAAPSASPYAPGETLNPTCTPGSTNCTVTPPIAGNGTSTQITFFTASTTTSSDINLTWTSSTAILAVVGTASSSQLRSPSSTITNLTLAGITGSTQCLQVNSAGLISGTAAGCGNGAAPNFVRNNSFISLATSTDFFGLGATTTARLTVGGLPTASATSSLVLLGSNFITGGNSNGTFLGANPTSTFSGDFVNFQVGSTTQFLITGAGVVSSTGLIASNVTSTNLFFTNATGSFLSITTYASTSQLFAGSSTIPALTFTNATGSSLTFTNATGTSATSSFGSAFISAITVSSTNMFLGGSAVLTTSTPVAGSEISIVNNVVAFNNNGNHPTVASATTWLATQTLTVTTSTSATSTYGAANLFWGNATGTNLAVNSSLMIATGTPIANGLLTIATNTSIFAINNSGQLMIATSTAATSTALLTIATTTSIFSINQYGQMMLATSSAATSTALLTIATTSSAFSVLSSGQVFIGSATTSNPLGGVLFIPAAGIASSTGINFGDGTANLYRSGAGVIQTDGTVNFAGGATMNGSTFQSVSSVTLVINGNKPNMTGAEDALIRIGQVNTVTTAPAAGVRSAFVRINGNFGPTSGAGGFNALNLSPIYNQFAGSAGVTGGIFINPTLTSVYDFRMLEVGTSTAGGTVYRLSTSTLLANSYGSLFNASTYTNATSSSATSSVTNAYNVAINGAPIATPGSSTITNSYGLGILTSAVTASTTNSYGLSVAAMTGASTNTVAVFTGGNFALGTTTAPLLFTIATSSPIFGTDNNSVLIATGTPATSTALLTIATTTSIFSINQYGQMMLATSSAATSTALLTIATTSSAFSVLSSGQVFIGSATTSNPLGGVLFIPAAGIASSTGINFGDGTANLYRSGAGTIQTDATLTATNGTFTNITAGTGSTLTLKGNQSSATNVYDISLQNNNNRTYTSGIGGQVKVDTVGSFSPTSGTGGYNLLSVMGTINQLYGSNSSGITRGILVSSTLTSAYDYRALEIGPGGTMTWNRSTSTTLTNAYSALFNGFTLSIGTSTVTSTVVTNAYNVAINGAPIATVGSSSITNSYGLSVAAMTGASTNTVAVFTGGNFALGTTTAPLLFTIATSSPIFGTDNNSVLIATSTAATSTALFTIATTSNILSVLTSGQLFLRNASTANPLGGTLFIPAGVASTTGINFGDGATNLYRSAASTLKTDAGFISAGTITAATTFTSASGNNISLICSSTCTTTVGGNVSTGLNVYSVNVTNQGTLQTWTSGNGGQLTVGGSYSPTSGSGVFNNLQLGTTVNQFYGSDSSGITRGVFINPTLTSAYDFRMLEVGTSTTGGTVWNRSTSTTLTNSYGALFNTYTLSVATSVVTSTVVTNAYNVAVNGAPIATVGSSSITNSYGLGVLTSAVTASTTNAYGLLVQTPTGATNNYGAAFSGSSSLMIATSTPYGATTTLTVCAKSNCIAPTTASSTNTVAFFASTAGNTTDISIVAKGVVTSGLADIGEYINVVGSPDSYAAGEVLSVSTTTPGSFERSTIPYDPHLAGVVTKTAGLIAGGGEDNHGSVVIALAGRIPVIVSNENGVIKTGDQLTASSLTGVAMKSTEPGKVIGTALGDWPSPSTSSGSPASPTTTGTVMMFVSNHYDLGTLNPDGTLGAASTSTPASGILDQFTALVDRSLQRLGAVIVNGIATLKEVIADKLTAKQLCLEDVCVTRDQLKQLLDQQNIGTVAPAVSPSNPPAPPPTPSPVPAPTPTPPAVSLPSPSPVASPSSTPASPNPPSPAPTSSPSPAPSGTATPPAPAPASSLPPTPAPAPTPAITSPASPPSSGGQTAPPLTPPATPSPVPSSPAPAPAPSAPNPNAAP